jgi:hypothetical protein
MLEILALLQVLLWPLGLVFASTLGGFIHGLLAIPLIMILPQMIRSGKPVA